MKKIQYKEVNGTSYHKNTPQQVIDILERARENRTRLLFDFGDTKTGKSWGEVYDIRGTIGRSTGTIKIPLLIKTTRSFGGGGLLDHCIIKITNIKTKQVLYNIAK
jgi:hypothetical protein